MQVLAQREEHQRLEPAAQAIPQLAQFVVEAAHGVQHVHPAVSRRAEATTTIRVSLGHVVHQHVLGDHARNVLVQLARRAQCPSDVAHIQRLQRVDVRLRRARKHLKNAWFRPLHHREGPQHAAQILSMHGAVAASINHLPGGLCKQGLVAPPDLGQRPEQLRKIKVVEVVQAGTSLLCDGSKQTLMVHGLVGEGPQQVGQLLRLETRQLRYRGFCGRVEELSIDADLPVNAGEGPQRVGDVLRIEVAAAPRITCSNLREQRSVWQTSLGKGPNNIAQVLPS
mmetsp:Transcript_45178/g.144711  ORF Transcript_45178/g.144711 Transcript_45178/m.144711 type:complete len:282 (+) Transcript_45178:1302-2147(+)